VNVTTAGRVLSNRYQVGELLGSGGMASVFRARDLRLDRAVAIKELSGAWLLEPAAWQWFEREARMAARLAHPNIVAVYDVDICDGKPYLVMELIEGVTVAQLLTEGPLPVSAVVSIAAQACEGLAAAHAARVIHRDIKPANLMLTDAGVLKICDFGIARALTTAADATAHGPAYAIGTGNYMAPEQSEGRRVDERADLYGLGCTMYAMLAGRPPFRGTAAEVLEQHRSTAPAPLRELRPEVPEQLDTLVMRLLAKDPDDRPTGAEVMARLADLEERPTALVIPVAHQVVRSRLVSTVAAPTRPTRRAGGRVIWLCALVVGLAAAILVAANWPTGPESAESPGPPAPTATASPTMTASAPAAATPSTTGPATRPTVQPSTPAPPGDPVAALRLAVQQQVSSGNLNPDKASDLYTRVDAIAHAAYSGNTTDEGKNIKAFQDRLTALRTGGQLSISGYDTLTSALAAVSAAMP
jgi:serine/threonine-protein kinase